MKGSVTVTFTAKEVVALLTFGALPISIGKKVLSALRASNVQPLGEKAATISRAKTATKKATKRTIDKPVFVDGVKQPQTAVN